MSRTYNMEIANLIDNFLKEDDWHYSFEEEDGVFRFGLRLENRLRHIRYLIKVNECDYSVYGISPVSADEEDAACMQSMAEYICRVNYGLKSGCFEMDMEDGEIRFHVHVYCKGILPSQEMIKRSIYTVAAMFEHYGQGLMDVIYGGKSAKAAYEACEKRTDSKAEVAQKLLELLRARGGGEEIQRLLSRLSAGEGAAPDDAQEDVEDDDDGDEGPMDVFEDADE